MTVFFGIGLIVAHTSGVIPFLVLAAAYFSDIILKLQMPLNDYHYTKSPDIYLLYEYMEKIPFTVRFKVQLDLPVDAKLPDQAEQESIERFPYFKVQGGVDEGRIDRKAQYARYTY